VQRSGGGEQPADNPRPTATAIATAPSATPTQASNGTSIATATTAPTTSASEDRPAAADSRPPSPKPAAPPPLDGEEEVRLLNEAHDALRTDPSRALSLANQHAQRAPRGTLAQEREVIAIEALVKLGRSAEAKQRAARFEAAYPNSAQLRRVRSLVGVGFDGGDHKRWAPCPLTRA
jgi:hypothetical protein